jgi:hypothetical protein
LNIHDILNATEEKRARQGLFRAIAFEAGPQGRGVELDDIMDVELISCVAVGGYGHSPREAVVNGLIYLIGLIVVIMFILSFLGLH